MPALRKYILLLVFAGLTKALFAGGPGEKQHPFIENKGQWEQGFSYKLKLRWGQFYFFDNKVVIDTWDQHQYEQVLESYHHHKSPLPAGKFKKHALGINFVNPSPSRKWITNNKSDQIYNFYLGNDSSRWKSGINAFESIVLKECWNGINLKYYINNGFLKYDFIAAPNANLNQIAFRYEGADKLFLKDGKLVIHTSVGDIEELEPVAYQLINGKRKTVSCKYVLNNGILSFKTGKEYQPGVELVIDPQFIFATYSGSAADNWGTTATFDSLGCAYAGGMAFNIGYPVTLGAYQSTFSGRIDCSITKFSATGNAAVYSTYLGGSDVEFPFSMVVDHTNQLLLMGVTGSSNFPVTSGVFDVSFNAGPPADFSQEGIEGFASGADLFVSKLSADGTQLSASSYLGGTGNDGFNMATDLNKNYGDWFRGEIIVDDQNNAYVVGSTTSLNLPVVNAWQPTYGGGTQDACVFKLNPQFNNLLVCSYFGGTAADAGYGMQLSGDGSLYFCGGTKSGSVSGNPVGNAFAGGTDGYIAKVNQAGGGAATFTYLGTPSYEQIYFVQVDNQGDIVVLGQTAGNYPISPPPGETIYSVAGGNLFFHKVNANLNQSIWSTRFGVPGSLQYLVPSAFLVDYCNYISFSLWGGNVNTVLPWAVNLPSTTIGLPVTPDAFQSTTTGSDFYLGILDDNAAALHYGTFFGGAQAEEHVDGGTSRFDKHGVIYQAICSGCDPSNADDMPVTPGVYSSTNNSANCNAAVFKFNLSVFTSQINEAGLSDRCINDQIFFENLSVGSNEFVWYFGDGQTSTEANPSHVYSDTGTYIIMLVANGTEACSASDTAYASILVVTTPDLVSSTVDPICKGDSVQLSVSGGTNYEWQLQDGLDAEDQNLSNPWVSPTQSADFLVISSNNCGLDSAVFPVDVIEFSVAISSNNLSVCAGGQIQLNGSAATSYEWSPAELFGNPASSSVTFTPDSSISVFLAATDANGCNAADTVLTVVDRAPFVEAPSDTMICHGQTLDLLAEGNGIFRWTIVETNEQFEGPIFPVTPDSSFSCILVCENSCGVAYDTVYVDVRRVFAVAGPTDTVCAYAPFPVFSGGGTSYRWVPSADFENPTWPSTILYPKPNVLYQVQVSDEIGCKATADLPIELYPVSWVSAGSDKIVVFGDEASLDGNGSGGVYHWFPEHGINCVTCPGAFAETDSTIAYRLELIDQYGCVFTDTMNVIVEGGIYFPNAFSPNGDGINDLFRPGAIDVVSYRLRIYNRWGQLLYLTEDVNGGWNGLYRGDVVQTDVYVYKADYILNSGLMGNVVGRVTVFH